MRNQKIKEDFIKYLEDNPDLRFWQAVRNFSGYPFIYASVMPIENAGEVVKDTFYWEGRDK